MKKCSGPWAGDPVAGYIIYARSVWPRLRPRRTQDPRARSSAGPAHFDAGKHDVGRQQKHPAGGPGRAKGRRNVRRMPLGSRVRKSGDRRDLRVGLVVAPRNFLPRDQGPPGPEISNSPPYTLRLPRRIRTCIGPGRMMPPAPWKPRRAPGRGPHTGNWQCAAGNEGGRGRVRKWQHKAATQHTRCPNAAQGSRRQPSCRRYLLPRPGPGRRARTNRTLDQ